jgi:hypothetical protein
MPKQNTARTGINFRTSFIHWRTKKRVYCRPGHPFPIPRRGNRRKPESAEQLTLPGMETVVETHRPPRPPAKVRTPKSAQSRKKEPRET